MKNHSLNFYTVECIISVELSKKYRFLRHTETESNFIIFFLRIDYIVRNTFENKFPNLNNFKFSFDR